MEKQLVLGQKVVEQQMQSPSAEKQVTQVETSTVVTDEVVGTVRDESEKTSGCTQPDASNETGF